jgi:hypothetical protein
MATRERNRTHLHMHARFSHSESTAGNFMRSEVTSASAVRTKPQAPRSLRRWLTSSVLAGVGCESHPVTHCDPPSQNDAQELERRNYSKGTIRYYLRLKSHTAIVLSFLPRNDVRFFGRYLAREVVPLSRIRRFVYPILCLFQMVRLLLFDPSDLVQFRGCSVHALRVATHHVLLYSRFCDKQLGRFRDP